MPIKQVTAVLKAQLNSREGFLTNIKQSLISLSVIVIVLGVLWLWYWEGQREAVRVCAGHCSPYYPYEFDGFLGYIEEGVSRNVSHIYHQHLYGNMAGFAFAAYFIVFYQRARIAIGQLYLTFVIMVYSVPLFFDGLGFSGVVYGTIALATLTILARLKVAFESWRSNIIDIILLVLFGFAIGQIVLGVVEQASVVLGFTSPSEFGIGDPRSDIPRTTTIGSLQMHVFGFCVGALVWITTYVLSQRSPIRGHSNS